VPAHVPLVVPAVLVQLTAGLAPWLATLPFPVPAPSTVRSYVGVNDAVTASDWVTVTTQLPVPEQAPLQPANTLPASGVATSVTTVPDK